MKMLSALMALLAVGCVFAGLSISDYSVSPETVEPGDYGVITLAISNPSATGAVDTVSITVSSAEQLGINRVFSVGDLEAGSSTILSVPFQAGEGIPSRIYTVNIQARGVSEIEYYSETSGNFKTKTETVEKIATIPVEVVEKPVLSISLSQDNIEDITPETFTITNAGGPAKKVKLSLGGDFGFTNVDQLIVGDVADSVGAEATIDARGASEGASKLEITLVYQDEIGNEYTETKEIPVTVKKTEGNFVFSQESPIVTGQYETITFTISNEGKGVEDITFHFSGDEVRLRGMNEVRVGDLGQGDSRQVFVPVVADLTPGTNNVEVVIEWVESGEDRLGTITVPIEVTSDSEVGVYLEAKPTPLYPGMEHTLSVTVSNLGSYNIEGVTVDVSSDAMELLTIQPEQYIGGLNTDDFSSVQYKVKVTATEAGTYPIDVNVKYKDASGRWVTDSQQLTVLVAPMASDGGSGIEMFALLIIVVAVLYWYFRMRKKK